ncbi:MULTISPECIES: MFS transporter [Staphylococcus]|uniref:MFS transporter n=8 Tax=Bacillales TaxID=1385 RepID=A0A640N243_BACAN|nr:MULTISPECIES: MFS transporter [Staphylococcus]GEU19699.1 MFS transporter [Bacillus anthracis]KKI58181.1 Ribitol/Xylitol/Arabitol transporter, MFS superfamily [Staphylococcus haemolyticus]MBC3012817.1 MFS transporter [Staphylococcus haemolyticus]MBC3114016.1 MFS transporter [Staphylococcus haemolyticus]MBC3123176.1 MFS transporter [Staphylococcus haemolyticus]
MANEIEKRERQFLGLPMVLIWGYIAVAIFMTGDGMEQAFLSKYIMSLGFDNSEAGNVLTVYGLVVAIASWLSGVMAEIFSPRRVMTFAFIIWMIFHVGFLVFGLEQQNYAMMMIMYGIRGLAYPMFIYSFVVWITYSSPSYKLASAMGWFWAMYSIGIGVLGSYLPSFSIPIIGEMGTLWSSLIFILIGGLIAMFLVKDKKGEDVEAQSMTKKEMLREFGRGITILKNKNVAVAFVVRIINQLSLFGLVVFLPHVYTADFGFTTSEWLRVWGLMYIITIFTNLFWGIMGDKIGWVRQVRWFGCIGMAVSTLAFYYFPAWSGPNIFVTTLIALMFGFAVAAFVPMSAIFPTLVPEHKGAAVSVHNLAAGLSNFLGYGLASVMLIFASAEVTIWAYAVIYVLGFVLTFFMKVQQPGRQVKTTVNTQSN